MQQPITKKNDLLSQDERPRTGHAVATNDLVR